MTVWGLVVLTALYVATARLGLQLDAASGFATLVWPPTAIAIAAVLVYGYRMWPGIAAGALLVNVWNGASVPVALGIAVGNTLEAVVAVYLLRRVGFHRSLDRLRDVVTLTLLAAVVSTTISATIGVASLSFGDRVVAGHYELTWLAWWWGDLGGALILLPLLLTWTTPAPRSAIDQPTRLEAFVLVVSLAVVGVLLFGGYLPRVIERPYLVAPWLLWSAIRFGPRGGSAVSVAVTAMAIASTVMDSGPFVGTTIQERLLDLQPFAVTSTLIALSLAAMAVGRANAALSAQRSDQQKAATLVELECAHAQLEQNVQSRTAELRQALCDKDVLLREIHHRVKNNLQVIGSLLALQSSAARPEVRPAFDESRQRIRSMGLVHELLYRSEELASIDFGEYLRRIVASVASSYGASNIEVTTSAPGVRLDIDAAVPCGLIVNELVCNSFKHAFPDRRGRIEVVVKRDRDEIALEVGDDGIGLPEHLQLGTARTLGLQIVNALTQQLRGKVHVVRDHGTRFCIRFPGPAHMQAAA